MLIQKFHLAFALVFTFAMASCNKSTHEESTAALPSCSSEAHSTKSKVMHPYGGWSCPDNIYGFPAVDLSDLSSVPAVQNRLPTREETRNGSSLMFFDTLEVPSARALVMELPQAARYYSEYTKKNELVIVIQAVEAEGDTVVGFRYLNGGNGSAWINEVSFLSEEQVQGIGPTPFVQKALPINASQQRVWEVITRPEYADVLGACFLKNAFFESEWKSGSKVNFMNGPDRVVRTGEITALWQDSYIQVDYNFFGDHYVEKFLLFESEDHKSCNLTVVSGPYGFDIANQTAVWEKWLALVKQLSEENGGQLVTPMLNKGDEC